MYSLKRASDGTGGTGELSVAVWLDETGVVRCEHDARPRIGVLMCVGSVSVLDSESFRVQTRRTSCVTNIVSQGVARVVFETESGSRYVWQVVTS
jgi:hypothetical protein